VLIIDGNIAKLGRAAAEGKSTLLCDTLSIAGADALDGSPGNNFGVRAHNDRSTGSRELSRSRWAEYK